MNKISNWYNQRFNTPTYRLQQKVNSLEKELSEIHSSQLTQEQELQKKESLHRKMTEVIPKIAAYYINDLILSYVNVNKDNLGAEFEDTLLTKSAFVRNKIQRLVSIVTNAYKEDPEKLRQYFNVPSTIFMPGLATSAYFNLTGDIRPCLEREWGGLGATVVDSPGKLIIGREQFWFSTIRRLAFKEATLSDYALTGSEVLTDEDKQWHYKTSMHPILKKSIKYTKIN